MTASRHQRRAVSEAVCGASEGEGVSPAEGPFPAEVVSICRGSVLTWACRIGLRFAGQWGSVGGARGAVSACMLSRSVICVSTKLPKMAGRCPGLAGYVEPSEYLTSN